MNLIEFIYCTILAYLDCLGEKNNPLNPPVKPGPKPKEPRKNILEKIYAKSRTQNGVKPYKGNRTNPKIKKYYSAVDLKFTNDSTPWCAIGLNWVLESVGLKGTRSALARSFLKWGVKLSKPEKNCIVVFWRTSKNSWQGHVGVFRGFDKNGNVLVYGFNQSGTVKLSTYSKNRVLGYRAPF